MPLNKFAFLMKKYHHPFVQKRGVLENALPIMMECVRVRNENIGVNTLEK